MVLLVMVIFWVLAMVLTDGAPFVYLVFYFVTRLLHSSYIVGITR